MILRAGGLPSLLGVLGVARARKLCQNPFGFDGDFQALDRWSAEALPEFCEFRQRACYTIKCNTEECGRTKLITCWKITQVGNKANPALRVHPGYNG
jgi:hypothetical protein